MSTLTLDLGNKKCQHRSLVENTFEYSVVAPGTRAYRDYLALRHKVFCEELKRLPRPSQFFSDVALESDDYDDYSLHVLCQSMETGSAVGCCRLILPSAKGLSITSRYSISHKAPISPSQIGEIGRLAITSELRRYRGEPSNAGLHQTPSPRPRAPSKMNKQAGPLVAMGLYREIFKLANKHGVTNCYAAMEPSLARLLARIGLRFQMAGPLNTVVQPPRQPYFVGAISVRKVMSNLDTSPSQFIFGSFRDMSASALVW